MQIKGATRVTGAIVGHVDKGYSGANSSLNLPPSLLTWVPVTWQPLQWASSFTKQTSSPSSRSSAKSNPTPKKGENKVVTKKAKLSDDGKSEATAQSSATTTAARKVAAELSNEDIDELRDLAEEAIKELHQYFRIIIMNRGRGAEMAISFREVRYSADAWGIDEVEPAFTALPELHKDDFVTENREQVKYLQEPIKHLREALHFKEAQIEVEERWILEVDVQA